MQSKERMMLALTIAVTVIAVFFLNAPHWNEAMIKGRVYDLANLDLASPLDEPAAPVCEACTVSDDCSSYHALIDGYNANGLRDDWWQTPCDPNSNADHLMCQTIAEDCSAYCAPRGETLPDGSYLEGLCSNSTEGDEIPCATNHVNMTYSHVCRRDPNYMNPEALPFGMHEDENDQIQKALGIVEMWNEDTGNAPTNYRGGLDFYTYWIWLAPLPALCILGFVGQWDGYQYLLAAGGFSIALVNTIRCLMRAWIATVLGIAIRHPHPDNVGARNHLYSSANFVWCGTLLMLAAQALMLCGFVMWMKKNDTSPNKPIKIANPNPRGGDDEDSA